MIRQNKINYFIWSIILIFLSLAIYLSFIGGYGSDEDTLLMIYVFESKLFTGKFVSSRFTEISVEIGIGFLSYFWQYSYEHYYFFPICLGLIIFIFVFQIIKILIYFYCYVFQVQVFLII